MQTIRLYFDVASARSFSEAAKRHDITQSAASQRISQLERKLGVTLIDRSVRPLELTAAGEEFMHGCREMIDLHDRLIQRVSRLRAPLAGQVRVAAIYSAGIDLLNHIKEEFEQQAPGVEITVEYQQHQDVYAAVQNGQCDLGILSYPAPSKDVGIIALRNEPMAGVCSPSHGLSHRKHVHASQLGAWPMAAFVDGLPVGKRIRRYLREHGVKPDITSTFDNIDTIKNAVAMTNQFSILPRRTVLREEAAGTLHVVELEPELVRPIGLIYARGREETNGHSHGRNGKPHARGGFRPAVQAFIDFMLKHAGPTAQATAESTGRPLVLTDAK